MVRFKSGGLSFLCSLTQNSSNYNIIRILPSQALEIKEIFILHSGCVLVALFLHLDFAFIVPSDFDCVIFAFWFCICLAF